MFYWEFLFFFFHRTCVKLWVGVERSQRKNTWQFRKCFSRTEKFRPSGNPWGAWGNWTYNRETAVWPMYKLLAGSIEGSPPSPSILLLIVFKAVVTVCLLDKDFYQDIRVIVRKRIICFLWVLREIHVISQALPLAKLWSGILRLLWLPNILAASLVLTLPLHYSDGKYMKICTIVLLIV